MSVTSLTLGPQLTAANAAKAAMMSVLIFIASLLLLLVSKVKHPDVADLQAFAVTAEGDVSLLVEHSGMVAVVDSVGIDVAALRAVLVINL